MSKFLLATLKQPSGRVIISGAMMSLQSEFYMIEMPKSLAEQVWDAQQTIYTIESNLEQVGTFTAICTGFIPYMRDGQELARASFVRNEFLNR